MAFSHTAALLPRGVGDLPRSRLLLQRDGIRQPGTNANAGLNIIESSGILSLAAVFVAAIFCTSAIVRDRDHKLEEIIFSTSATRRDFLLGRFLGAFLATASAAATSLFGLMIGAFMPIRDGVIAGPFNPLHYLYAFVTMLLPNVFFVTVILFAAAALTRSAVGTYTTSIFIYVAYMVTSLLTDSPMMAGANREATIGIANALADPFGLAPYFAETRYWTIGEKNHRLLSIAGLYMLNRLVWIAAAGLAGAFLFRTFTFRLLEEKKSRKKKAEIETPPEIDIEVQPVKTSVRLSSWQGFLKSALLETKLLLLNRNFAVLTVVWCVLVGIELSSDISMGEYGTATMPAAGVIFATLIQPLRLLSLVLIIYFSGEVVWRERNSGMIDVINATPQKSFSFIGAKWFALTAMIAFVAVAALLMAVGQQLFHGFTTFDLPGNLKFLLVSVAPMAALAAAALLIHTLSPNRNAGLLLVLLLVIFIEAAERFDLHPLLQFANARIIRYSDMQGFRGAGTTYSAWMAHWLIAATILAWFASASWRRGLVVRKSKAFLTIALGAFLISGAALYYDTNVLKRYRTDNDVQQWKADYENTYKALRSIPKPTVTHVEANIALYPSEERAHVVGKLFVVNRTAAPMDRIVVAVRSDASNEKLSFEGAQLESHDAKFNNFHFKLTSPLAPGATSALHFDLTLEEKGLRSGQMPVSKNGTMMMAFRIFPTFGYRRSYEISDNDTRHRYGLPPIQEEALSEEAVEEGSDEWVTTDITLSTSADETAVVSGDLEKSWTENGRNFFRYRVKEPMRYVMAVASGAYRVERDTRGKLPIEIFYDAAHAENVQKILDTTRASLEYQEATFGPYAHQAMRIVEIPASYEMAGYAQPGVIYLGERRLFQIDPKRSKGVDVIARRVAHEVAHQWWGLMLSPSSVDGNLLITESLAKYSELVITEKMFGPSHTRQQLDYELDRYLGRRGSSAFGEPPLSRVRGESEIYYAKGALVLNAIRHLIGETQMNAALRSLFTDQSGPKGRSTAPMLIERLKAAAANEEDRILIDRWMNDTAVYDLKIDKASVKRVGGAYEITASYDASRVTVDSKGNESRTILNERLPFAVFDADGKVIHSEKVRIDKRSGQLSFRVTKKPAQLVVDPDLTRIDPSQRDNTVQIQ